MVYAIYLYLGVYITKCNLGLGFLKKFNVVLGVMWLKVIEKNRKASGLKRKRLERFDPLETSSLSFLVIRGI